MSVLNIKGKELTVKEMAIIKTKSNIFYMKKNSMSYIHLENKKVTV